MELKTLFAQDASGNVIAAPAVHLYQLDGITLAAGLEDAAGAGLPNPLAGEDTGRIQLAAPDGDYVLRIVGAGRDYRQRVRFIDVTATAAQTQAAKDSAQGAASEAAASAASAGSSAADAAAHLAALAQAAEGINVAATSALADIAGAASAEVALAAAQAEAATSAAGAAAASAQALALEYGVFVTRDQGIAAGSYYADFSTAGHGLMDRIYARVLGGSGSAFVTFVVDGAIVHPTFEVTGTPVRPGDLAIAIPAASLVSVHIEVTGEVTALVAKMEGTPA